MTDPTPFVSGYLAKNLCLLHSINLILALYWIYPRFFTNRGFTLIANPLNRIINSI
jgi:hypothetical protein